MRAQHSTLNNKKENPLKLQIPSPNLFKRSQISRKSLQNNLKGYVNKILRWAHFRNSLNIWRYNKSRCYLKRGGWEGNLESNLKRQANLPLVNKRTNLQRGIKRANHQLETKRKRSLMHMKRNMKIKTLKLSNSLEIDWFRSRTTNSSSKARNSCTKRTLTL